MGEMEMKGHGVYDITTKGEWPYCISDIKDECTERIGMWKGGFYVYVKPSKPNTIEIRSDGVGLVEEHTFDMNTPHETPKQTVQPQKLYPVGVAKTEVIRAQPMISNNMISVH